MAKFVWIVIDLDDCSVQGTNDTDYIDSIVDDDQKICIHVGSRDFAVIDPQTRDSKNITEIKEKRDDEEEEED